MNFADHPIETLSKSLYHCLYNVFTEQTYNKLNVYYYRNSGKEMYNMTTVPNSIENLEVVGMFPQLWGSTALGFHGSIGGAAMTTAYTIIIKHENKYAVYFGGKFAYSVENPNDKFMEDMKNHDMKNTKECEKYNTG